MNQERLMKVILGPHVTEKSTLIGEKYNQIVFKVMKDATKTEIKKAIEVLFKVEIESVRVSNIKGKRKIFKGKSGTRSDFKKSYVRLKPGFSIDASAV